MAGYHLLWEHIPTPFTSVFNNLRRALNWVQRREDRYLLELVVVDTYNVPSGCLWDAHRMAIEFGFPPERVGYHENEYLFYGGIEQERVLGVFPAAGTPVTIPVHLGELRVPGAFIGVVGSADEEEVKTAIAYEVYSRCGYFDRVRWEQTLHALCSRRFDDLSDLYI